MKVSIGNTEPTRVVRTGARFAAVLALGLFALSGPAASQSITPQNVNPGQHFLDCFGAMIHDSTAHAADCDPGHTVFVSGSTGYGGACSGDDDVSCGPPPDTSTDDSDDSRG